MIRYSFGLVVMLSLVLISACGGSSPAQIDAGLGQQFTLEFDQTASINGEPLKIKFTDVVSDSRCPTGVECVWEGEVSCLLDITYNGTSNVKTITESGSSSELASAEFNNYEIRFHVQPYPEANKKIEKKDYSLTLEVNKK